MNKFIGNITSLRELEFEAVIYESSETKFVSVIRCCDLNFPEERNSYSDFFYDIKRNEGYTTIFHISSSAVSVYLPPKLYDKKNSYPKSNLSREGIINSVGAPKSYNLTSAIQLLEIFPFMEKEVKNWIVLFAENRKVTTEEITAEDINTLLAKFFKK